MAVQWRGSAVQFPQAAMIDTNTKVKWLSVLVSAVGFGNDQRQLSKKPQNQEVVLRSKEGISRPTLVKIFSSTAGVIRRSAVGGLEWECRKFGNPARARSEWRKGLALWLLGSWVSGSFWGMVWFNLGSW